MGFLILIIIIVIISLLGFGEIAPLLFVGYILLGILYSALIEGELGGFFKIFVAPILLLLVVGFFFSQCSNPNIKRSNTGSSWWKSNTCTQGSWFDKFSDGRGQWRNPDGKFCSK